MYTKVAVRGEILLFPSRLCQREIGYTHNPFAVKVTKSGNIVRHLLEKMSSMCSSEVKGNAHM